MPFDLPFAGPFTQATYPVVLPYDVSDPLPANWRLRITVGVPAQASLDLLAVCDGTLSAVPPDELPPSWFGLITIPSGQTPTAPIRLYLQPLASQAAASSLVDALGAAGLGSEVRWFVYENVDPAALASALSIALANDPRFAQISLTGSPLTPAQRLEAFLNGATAITVARGAVIGQAAPIAGAGTQARATFGVQTDTGYVDPATFFAAIQPSHGSFSSPTLADFLLLVPSQWPILRDAATADDVIREASLRLYPLPVLADARTRCGLDDAQWRTVGDGQKLLYWEQLLNNSSGPSLGPPFIFNLDDMVNPFQLEAVAEFFIAWPSVSSAITPPGLPPSPARVDFLKPTIVILRGEPGEEPVATEHSHRWDIVIIDSFSHPLLGSPALPKPDFSVKNYAPDGGQCDPAGPVKDPVTNAYPSPDAYAGVLFLVHKGQVDRWYRWSTMSGYKFEDDAADDCGWASSIEGNRAYLLRSRMANGAPKINYALALWDADTSRNTPFNDQWVPGKFCYRTGLPPDPDGKTQVLIHTGRTTHHNDQQENWNGSAGCIVSPQYYALRNRMIALYQQDYAADHNGAADPDLAPLENADRARSEALYNQATGSSLADWGSWFSGASMTADRWDGKIVGQAYVIRPDETTKR